MATSRCSPGPWMLAVALLVSGSAMASTLDASGADALVRAVWYEGLPFDEAARIGPDGAAHLASLLADPSESAHHANALLALAISGQPGAYEAIAAWAGVQRSGEVDRGTFRAWQTLPFALGHLARSDSRAFDALALRLTDRSLVGWHFRHFDAARLREMGRRGAALGLASSGLPRARTLLAREKVSAGAGARWRAHLEESLAFHARVERDGAAAVFGSAGTEGVR